MQVVGETMNDVYKMLCGKIVATGHDVAGTREIRNASFTLLNIEENVASIRTGLSMAYMLGELVWYFTGRKDVAFISKFSSFWAKLSDDGVHSNSAYGDIVFNRYGYNQLEQAIKILTDDKDSRRAVINFNVPNVNRQTTHDDPCTIALEFAIRDGKLDCTCVMRSNDIWLGTPYDVVFFTALQKYIADRLGVAYGIYTHFAISLHVYDRHLDDIKKIWYTPKATKAPKVHIDTTKLMEYSDYFAELCSMMGMPGGTLVDACKRRGILTMEENHED